jgi:hypothetical protein
MTFEVVLFHPDSIVKRFPFSYQMPPSLFPFLPFVAFLLFILSSSEEFRHLLLESFTPVYAILAFTPVYASFTFTPLCAGCV